MTPGTRAGPATPDAPRRWCGTCQNEGLRPDETVVYLCGNPEMIINVESVLLDADYPEFHVKKELYWPKDKKPAA